MHLQQLLTPARLRKMAGPTSFARGEQYARAGAVRQLQRTEREIRAMVQGTAAYRVRVWAHDDALHFECDCPFASAMAAVCKHFVAVGLAAAEVPLTAPAVPPKPARLGKATRNEELDELGKYLRAQDVDTLAQLLLNVARSDRSLCRALLEQARDKPFDESALRDLIDDSTHMPYFIFEHEARDVALVMERMLDALTRARTAATAPMLVRLLEYAYERVESALGEIDDSGGYIGDIMLRIGHLHLETCLLARPDPVALAQRLFELGTASDLGVWEFDHQTYAAALGEAGLSRYRQLAAAAWAALGPPGGDYDPHEWPICRIMEKLAEGDVHMKVQVLARDLSDVHRYRVIVHALRDAGSMDEALDWAQQGLAAYPASLDRELCDVVAAHHLRQGEAPKASALRLRQFTQHPTLEVYQALALAARKARHWPAVRLRALQQIDLRPGDMTLRVAIALWEEDVDTAWRYAEMGMCAPELLVALATALESRQPEEAFACYRRIVHDLLERQVDLTRPIYEEAVGHIKSIIDLLTRVGRSGECAVYLQFLRTQYERKRNFIRMLDGLNDQAS